MRRKGILAMLVFVLLFTLCTALYGCTASGAPAAENAVYTVVFRDGEETLATVSFKEGERLRESDFPALPEKQGYLFAGWFYEERKVEAGFLPQSDCILSAKYDKAYTVSFFIGSERLKTVLVRAGDTVQVEQFPLAAMEGFLFDGWYSGQQAFTAQTQIVADTVVCAAFVRVWKVAFSYNGVLVGNEVFVRDGHTVQADQLPALSLSEEYEFDGWFCGTVAASDFIVKQDAVFIARVTRLYPVRFFIGEEVLSTVFVRSGEKIAQEKIPSAPARPQYDFDGWFYEDVPVKDIFVTREIEARAVYTRLYTVSFCVNESVFERLTVRAGEIANEELFPVLSRPDCAFLGWYTQAGENLAQVAVTQTLTVTPLFVGESDYNGVWACEEEGNELLVAIDSEAGTVTIGEEVLNGNYSFDQQTGGISYTISGVASYSMQVFHNRITLTKRDYSAGGVTFITLVKEAADIPSALAGSYMKNHSDLVISAGGYVLSYCGAVRFGKITQADNGYQLAYLATAQSNFKTVSLALDEAGNLILRNGISSAYNGLFVKNAESADVYTSGTDTFTLYCLASGTVCVYYANAEYDIVTPSVLPVVGGTLTFSIGNEVIEIYIAAEGRFEYVT